MNKVILMGRLTRDIEMRYSQGTSPLTVGKFSLAVARKFKRDNESEADFINCVAFGKTAENIDTFFCKGRMIMIEGRIQTGSYDGKDGKKVYTTDVIVDSFYFTGEKKEANTDQKSSAQQYNEGSNEFFDYDDTLNDDDLPF